MGSWCGLSVRRLVSFQLWEIFFCEPVFVTFYPLSFFSYFHFGTSLTDDGLLSFNFSFFFFHLFNQSSVALPSSLSTFYVNIICLIYLLPWLGGSVSCSIIPVPQKGCGFDSQLGWVRKATDLSLKKDNNKSINRSLDKDFFLKDIFWFFFKSSWNFFNGCNMYLTFSETVLEVCLISSLLCFFCL